MRRLARLLMAWALLSLAFAGPAYAADPPDDSIPPLPCPPDTDPGLPIPPGCPIPSVGADSFCLALAPTGLGRAGERVDYSLSVSASGREGGDELVARLPYPADQIELLGVSFSRRGPWVQSAGDGLIVMALGSLERGDSVTATLRMRVRDKLPADALLALRSSLSWAKQTNLEPALSNRSLTRAGSPADAIPADMLIEPAGPGRLTAGYDGFASYERTGIWLDGPDGSRSALGSSRADAAGALRFTVSTAGLAPGAYRVVAQGVCSGAVAVGAFTIR